MIVIALYTLNAAHPGRLISHVIKPGTSESDREVATATPSELEAGSKEVGAGETK